MPYAGIGDERAVLGGHKQRLKLLGGVRLEVLGPFGVVDGIGVEFAPDTGVATAVLLYICACAVVDAIVVERGPCDDVDSLPLLGRRRLGDRGWDGVSPALATLFEGAEVVSTLVVLLASFGAVPLVEASSALMLREAAA